MLSRGELQRYAKKSKFENFDSALYSASVSMPLNTEEFVLSDIKPRILDILILQDKTLFGALEASNIVC